MVVFPPRTRIQASFALVNEAGQALNVASLRWRLTDEDAVVLQDWTALAVPAAGQEAQIEVIPALNILTPPATMGVRVVELEVTTVDGGVRTMEMTAMLRGLTALAVGENSFQVYTRAQLHAASFSSLDGWVESEAREAREAALIEAFRSIMRLPISIPDVGDLGSMTAQEVISLVPDDLMVQLQRAQVLEANVILEDDPIAAARANGAISITVGESSQFFKSTSPAPKALRSEAALQLLRPWMSRSTVYLARG